MKKPNNVRRTAAKPDKVSEMRTVYDFSEGVRGKYAKQFAKGTNLVLLDPDIAKAFRNGKAVNRALRAILDAIPTSAAKRSRKRPA